MIIIKKIINKETRAVIEARGDNNDLKHFKKLLDIVDLLNYFELFDDAYYDEIKIGNKYKFILTFNKKQKWV